MTSLFTDIRHAFRTFSRARGFALTAVVVIGLGIATNVAVFSVADALLFRPIGGPRSGDVVGIYARDAAPNAGHRPFSGREFEVVRETARPFARVFAQEMTSVGVAEGEMTRRAFAAVVSPDYFAVLDALPTAGRGFVDAEGVPGGERVVVLSHAYASRLGPTQSVIGRRLTINAQPYTVVGIAPSWFAGTMAPFSPEMWIPTGSAPTATGTTESAAAPRFALVAALQPGLTRDAASARLGSIAGSLRSLDSVANAKLELSIADVSKLGTAAPNQNGEMAGVAFFMMGMSAVVLLIACLNLANLLLARSRTRGREMAVRLAVGSSRTRILGQLLTESLVLSLTGAAVGLLLGVAGTNLLARSLAPVLPFSFALTAVPDLRTVTLAVGLALASAAAFGLGPAIRLARTDLATQLKEVPGDLPGSRRMGFRHALVVGQLALSLVLLTAAGLFTVGAMASFSATPGFSLDGGIVATVDPSLAAGSVQPASQRLSQVAGQLRQVPGVASVALATSVPYGTEGGFGPIRIAGRTSEDETMWTRTVGVTADYFRTVRLPLLRGRGFSEAEAGTPTATARVAIVDEPLARQLWPGQDPVGRLIEVGEDKADGGTWRPVEIVGVVPGVRDDMDSQPGRHLYLPFDAAHQAAAFVHVRVASNDPAAELTVRDAVGRQLRQATGLPLLSVKTLKEHRDGSLYHWIAKASAQVFLAFGLAALVLAVLGVYGVKSYLVACRRREIGIRVAIGATALDVLRLVVADGAWLTLAGLSVGVAMSVGVCQLLGSWVYGIPGINPLVLLLAALVLGGSSLLAAYVPARRAVAVAPIVALGRE